MTYNRIRAHVDPGQWGNRDVGENLGKLQQIIQSMSPDTVRAGGSSFSGLAGRLQTTMDLLRYQAGKLAEAWGGEDAEAAMKQMKSLHSDAQEMHGKSADIGEALSAHADCQASWQAAASSWTDEMIVTADTFGNEDGAKNLMGDLQNHTYMANNAFPSDLRSPETSIGANSGGQYQGASPGGMPSAPGGGAYALPSGGSGGHLPSGMDGGGFPGGSSGGDIPGGATAQGIPGGGTDLAGFSPPGGGGGGLSGGLGGGGLSGGLGGGGLGAGGIGGGSGAGMAPAGSPFFGAGTGAAGAGGGAEKFPGAGPGSAAGAAPSTRGATGGGPMGQGGGHGGGGEEEERQRNAWLAEDEDIWGTDDGAAPPVIG